MKRYIDADKLAKLASNSTNGLTANDIMRFPREDVVPVKHAKWLYHECVITGEGLEGVYECSDCHAAVDESAFDLDSFHKEYCGACGAKMNERSRQ